MTTAPTLADALLKESFHKTWRRLDPITLTIPEKKSMRTLAAAVSRAARRRAHQVRGHWRKKAGAT